MWKLARTGMLESNQGHDDEVLPEKDETFLMNGWKVTIPLSTTSFSGGGTAAGSRFPGETVAEKVDCMLHRCHCENVGAFGDITCTALHSRGCWDAGRLCEFHRKPNLQTWPDCEPILLCQPSPRIAHGVIGSPPSTEHSAAQTGRAGFDEPIQEYCCSYTPETRTSRTEVCSGRRGK